MSYSFSGKVVWITGASSGIGEALVHSLSNYGAKIILSARREDELRRVQQQSKLKDSDSLVLPIDLYNPAAIETAYKKAVEKFGQIDILICNAGVAQRSTVMNSDPKVERQIMELNYFAVTELTRLVLPSMISHKQGNIVVISSVMGKMGMPGRATYCASKHALHGYYEALRAEVFKDNVKVHVICPGYVKTNVSINAVTADGSAHGKMDAGQEKGITPEKCARGIINAIAKGKDEVYIGGMEILAPRVKTIFPGLISYFVKRTEFHP